MRIALVWNGPFKLIDITTRYEPYVEGLRAIGIEVITVCPAGTEIGYPYSTVLFNDYRELICLDFWNELGCSAAVIITWQRMTDIMLCMRAAGMRVLAVAESDGEISLRFHPWQTFRFLTFMQKTTRLKIGAIKHWLTSYIAYGKQQINDLIENTESAHITTFAGEGAVNVWTKFLTKNKRTNLINNVKWLPYPVNDIFCSGPIQIERENRIIAIGRWDSPQKNAELLEKTIIKLESMNSKTEIIVVGKYSEERFKHLCERYPFVKVMGVQPKENIKKMMQFCRSILITSRWESGPIVANEMLALGGTVIGTPIVNLVNITKDSIFGIVSTKHSSFALAMAIQVEMEFWETGNRSPFVISSFWRHHLSPKAVSAKMIRLLDLEKHLSDDDKKEETSLSF
jgi:hypothetical protein